MIWIYVLTGTIGLVLIVPPVFQALDRRVAPGAAPDPPAATARIQPYEFAAFALTAFGVAGTIITQFDAGARSTFIAALTLGLAAGALHIEVLAALGRPPNDRDGTTRG